MKHRRIILVALVAFVSFVSGGWLLQGTANTGRDVRERAQIFQAVLRYVAEFYVDSIDPADLYDWATQGLLDKIDDPYTSYLEQAGYEELSISTTGDYGGVGLRIDSRDGWIQVVAPIADGPAERAGFESGDQLVAVEGESMKGWSSDKAASVLRGEPGTQVRVSVRRAGFPDSLHFTLTRDRIHVNSVEGPMLVAPEVGYVRLTTVSRSSSAELQEAIEGLRSEGARSMVIDLRNNPGGLLEQGVALADMFLERGDIVVETKGRARGASEIYRAVRSESWPEMPVVVLVNGATASSAEILSGALQDHDRAIAVGTPTFGKGVAYLLIELTEREAVTVTSSRWYTPSGRSIQRVRPRDRTNLIAAAPDGPDQPMAAGRAADSTVFRTEGGRILEAGHGGIQPDIEVPRDTLTDGEQAFAAALGSKIPDYRNVLTRYALRLKGENAVSSPDFEVTQSMLDEILIGLREADIEMPDSTFRAGQQLVAEQFGYELTRYAFGRQAELRRLALDDKQISKAVELLESARTPAELIGRATGN